MLESITIHTVPGFDEWRDAARHYLSFRIRPEHIDWQVPNQSQDNLFETEQTSPSLKTENTGIQFKVSKEFIELAQTICCHTDIQKFDLLYRLLFRLNFENKNLLKIKTDDDVLLANKMAKEVRRDAYKIKAFLRFRSLEHEGEEYFIAWYEPFHYSLELVMPFFTQRFKNMNWSILTPYRAAHWNQKEFVFQDNPDPSQFPKDDKIEQYWLGYYSSIFNPARYKKQAMLSQMPKKYWKNMPETALIEDLLRTSEAKTKDMIEKSRN